MASSEPDIIKVDAPVITDTAPSNPAIVPLLDQGFVLASTIRSIQPHSQNPGKIIIVHGDSFTSLEVKPDDRLEIMDSLMHLWTAGLAAA